MILLSLTQACVTVNFESFPLVRSILLLFILLHRLPRLTGERAVSLQDDFNPLLSGEHTLPLTRF